MIMEEIIDEGKQGDQYLVWFDTEYSGLELEEAHLLQVAVLITDRRLRRVLPCEMDIRLAIRLPAEATVSPWVEENLPDLVAACRSSLSVEPAEAEQRLIEYVDTAVGPPAERENRRPILAGNSIHADWWLARKYLPQFMGRLHYRHLDVTALKIEWQERYPDREFEKEDPESIKRYFPESFFSAADTRHDAYYDIQASIAELAFYRHLLFRP
jgi:oligoribonuclease